MIRSLLQVTVVALIGSAWAQTGASQVKRVVRHPDLRLEHADVPMYPLLARTARISGTVMVEVTVKKGRVTKTEVKSGPPVLARAAVGNIESWRFHPLVNATFTTTFVYRLESSKSLDPQNSKVELELPLFAKITATPVWLDTEEGPAPTTH